MDPTLLSIIAIAGGVLILAGWVNQIIKGYRSKSLHDVSRYLLYMILAGAMLWIIYGAYIEDSFIIGTNIVAIIFMGTILVMKYKYGKDEEVDLGKDDKCKQY